MKTLTIVKMTYRELETLLTEHFPGIDPDLIAREEWSNYEEHSFTVNGILDNDDTAKLEKYIAGEWTRYGTTDVLLNALCLKGAIPADNYLIDVSW
jgi:hypothetical protein